MTNGALWDLYVAGIVGCALAALGFIVAGVWWMTEWRNARRPFDWQKDAPEYGYAKDTHVKVVK